MRALQGARVLRRKIAREARRAIDDARDQVAAVIGCQPGEAVFTSGGTEANNQVLHGVPGPVAVSAIEHDSVLAAAPDAVRLPVDAEGRIDLAVERRRRRHELLALHDKTGRARRRPAR